VTAPSPSPGSASPSPQPGYGQPPQGWWGLTYVKVYSRWVPVPGAWVSLDSTRYAYPGGDGVYVQNIANGTQSALGEGRSWVVIDVEAEGVYAVTGLNGGLWLLPFSGAPKQVTSSGFWQAISHGAAYGTATSAVPSGAANTILRLDLKTETTTDWFTRPGAQSSVVAFDVSGNPVMYVQGQNGLEVWIVTGANSATVIAYTGGYSGFYPNGSPVADSHGLWLMTNQGIEVFSGGTWYWMSRITGQLAGGCS